MFWNGEICAGLLSLYETFPDESSIDAKDKTRTKIFFFYKEKYSDWIFSKSYLFLEKKREWTERHRVKNCVSNRILQKENS